MAKKKGGLSHVYPKDKRAFSLLAKSGAMSKDHAVPSNLKVFSRVTT